MPNYEELSPHRFQQFCQALLSYEHPDLQAYPLDQVDGGRDATAGPRNRQARAVVFQVKFASRPQAVADPVTWLRAALRGERDKIARLAQRGVESYRLVTNLPGSARLDSGQMDRLAEVLAELPISDAMCLWRADIDARLAKHPFLKWSFRELWSGQDLLDGVILDAVAEHHERRIRALRGFLSAQADEDGTVRFRQVGLRQELLNLWVDVPLVGLQYGDVPATAPNAEAQKVIDGLGASREASSIPAAYALLYGASPRINRLIVRGAPGQGKSTLSQLICQVHRCRILGDEEAIARIGPYRDAPLRLPFRVDVKHLASYLAGRDTLTHRIAIGVDSPRSLDGFLAHLVSVASGGDTFGVSDLKACLALGPTLVVLDGLDEVADPGERAEVVEAIERGAVTLDAVNPGGVRIVVTSRPTAFTSASTFYRERWQETSLVDLPRRTILAYAGAWAATHGLDQVEQSEMSALLEERLTDVEFSELTRNPMQLTIVLSLLLRRGRSLPDKRTQLYAEYMGHFLDREAEKSRVVAEHRDLIFQLHAYLAFQMHGASEAEGSDGKIEINVLRCEIESFVRDREGGSELVERLFEGIVERVMALVSRDGRFFEFEVQPLREFFAGYYLYDSAPVARYEWMAGTLPDRFELLSKSPYWLNVLRFFAGCYTNEALSSLADGVGEFYVDPLWANTDQPRVVAAMLLRDRVFSLNLHARDRTVQRLLAGVPTDHALSWGANGSDTGGLRLSESSAVGLLAERAIEVMADESAPLDRRVGMTHALVAHADHQVVRRLWYERFSVATDGSRDFLARAGCMGHLGDGVPTDDLLGTTPSDALVLAALERDPAAIEAVDEFALQAVTTVVRRGAHLQQRFGTTSPVYVWALAVTTLTDGSWGAAVNRQGGPTVNAICRILGRPRGSHDYPEHVISATAAVFGWSMRLICDAIEIVTSRERLEAAFRDKRGTFGLFGRLELEGSRWDAAAWMEEHANQATSDHAAATYVSLLMWGDDSAVNDLTAPLAAFLDDLDDHELVQLLAAIRWATETGYRARRRGTIAPTKTRLGVAMLARQPAVVLVENLGLLARDLTAADAGIQAFSGDLAFELIRRGHTKPVTLEIVAAVYGGMRGWLPKLRAPIKLRTLKAAEPVLEDRARYPLALVEAAEERFGGEARANTPRFVDAAGAGGWA